MGGFRQRAFTPLMRLCILGYHEGAATAEPAFGCRQFVRVMSNFRMNHHLRTIPPFYCLQRYGSTPFVDPCSHPHLAVHPPVLILCQSAFVVALRWLVSAGCVAVAGANG